MFRAIRGLSHVQRDWVWIFVIATLAIGVAAPTRASYPLAPMASAPKAYVGLFKDNAVAVLDTGSRTILSTIAVPAGPHGMVLTPDGKTLYVSSDGDSKVTIIDTTTDTARQSIEVGKAPHGLAIVPDGSTVLVAGFGTSAVAFIDTSSNTVAGQVPVANPHNIAIDPHGMRAFVASQDPAAPALAVIDLASRTVTGSVPLDKVPRALNLTPDGSKLFFTIAGDDAVEVLDTASLQVTDRVPVGASPHHPLVTPDGQHLLVVSQGPGELASIDPASDQVLSTVKVGTNPHWIALDPDGATAYVTNEGSGDVSVVDIGSMSVVASLPVGNGPRKIVVQAMPGAGTGTATTSAPASVPTMTPPQQLQPVPAQSGDGSSMVTISGFSFNPASESVAAGRSITITNNDAVMHTTTSDDGVWDSGPLEPGSSYTILLAEPGTYGYHCSIHPFMQGTITVTG